MNKVFTALETFYHGYRFRSRLEARWAVFFDQLAVSYRYEPEGYLLEGRRYLPDFYLQEQDCFVEIKPRRPDTEELEKTRLLALHTGKEVYTVYGDVWLAERSLHRQICRYTPPKISAFFQTTLPNVERADFQQVAVLLQKLDDVGLTLLVQEKFLTLCSTTHFDTESFRAQHYLPTLQKQCEQLAELSLPLQRLHDALIEALAEQSGHKPLFVRQQLSWDFAWAQCSACGNVSLRNEQEEDGEAAFLHEYCPRSRPGRYCSDSTRLKAAYVAARQERFST